MKKIYLYAGIGLIVTGLLAVVLGFTYFKNRGDLDEKFFVNPVVMPMAYKVYGNPEVANGKYYLVKAVFRNSGKGSIKNFKISYRIPGYIDWTTPVTYEEILPSQTVVDLFYPKFPRKILDVLNTTPASVEIRYTYSDGVKNFEKIKRKNFEIRGRNELVYTDMPQEEISEIQDMFTNVNLLACFVTPEDPVIKYFTQQLQKNVLQGTTAGIAGGSQEVQRFMQGLYEFEKAAGIVYGGTLGLPEKIGDKISVVQHIRLPREVLTGGAGLCVELSILFASVAESAGLRSLIFVTQHHAFPGIETRDGILAIEATGVGGEAIGGKMSFEQAMRVGTENAKKFLNGEPVDGAMPVALLRINNLHAQGYRPPDLEDDPSLRKKIDSIFKNLFRPTPAQLPYKEGQRDTMQNNRENQPIPTHIQPLRYQDPNGIFSFSYPANWQLLLEPIPALPYLRLIVADPAMSQEAEVYYFHDIYSPAQAIQRLYTILTQQLGESIQYRPLGSIMINGVNFTRYTGVTTSQGIRIAWVAHFTSTSQGVVGFVLGSYTNQLDTPQLKLIQNSFKVVQ